MRAVVAGGRLTGSRPSRGIAWKHDDRGDGRGSARSGARQDQPLPAGRRRAVTTATTTSPPPTRPSRSTRTCGRGPTTSSASSFTAASTRRACPTDASNLAIRAAKLLARTAGVPGGVHLEIEKHVPIAGGMGGGSADAAATLVACDAMWGTDALEGGAARARGEARRRRAVRPDGRHRDRHRPRRPAEPRARDRVVPLGAGARRVRAPDARRLPRARPAPRAAGACASRRSTRRPTVDARCCRRCAPATRACSPTRCTTTSRPPRSASSPALGGMLELGESHGALAGIVSGSGPTVAFLADDADSALELQIALSAARLNAVHVHGPVHGARIVH